MVQAPDAIGDVQKRNKPPTQLRGNKPPTQLRGNNPPTQLGPSRLGGERVRKGVQVLAQVLAQTVMCKWGTQTVMCKWGTQVLAQTVMCKWGTQIGHVKKDA